MFSSSGSAVLTDGEDGHQERRCGSLQRAVHVTVCMCMNVENVDQRGILDRVNYEGSRNERTK